MFIPSSVHRHLQSLSSLVLQPSNIPTRALGVTVSRKVGPVVFVIIGGGHSHHHSDDR
ncbi:hypothetical protein QE435_003948 [Rhizobium sp. SORGH_AS 787]|nr:hypothetical protein [Rhizobium sp. SORGH_AS_0787]